MAMFKRPEGTQPTEKPAPTRFGRRTEPDPDSRVVAPTRTGPVNSRPQPTVAAPEPSQWFAGFETAEARRHSENIFPGIYLLQLRAFLRKVSQKPQTRGNQLFVSEWKVLDVEYAYEGDQDYRPSNRVGAVVGNVENVTKYGDSALTSMKSQLLAIAQCDDPEVLEQDISPAQWREAIDSATEPPGTLWEGYVLRCVASKKPTTAGKPFTAKSWEPHMTAAEYKSLR